MAAEKARSKPSAPLACPFCNSLETIFRYFIDYDVKRRRHFCKNCDRHFAAVKSRSSEIITGGEESRGRDQGWTFMASSREFNRPEVGTVGEASHGLEGGIMGLTAPSGGYWKSGMAAERARLKPTTPVACPRCHSLKTKFRYFNNYDIKQPRFSCDNCDRDWTAGGRKRKRYIGFQEPDGEIQNSKEPVNDARISSFDDELTRVSSVTGVAGIDLNVPGREETGGANPDGFVDSLTVDGISGTEFSNLMDTGRKRKATSTENSE